MIIFFLIIKNTWKCQVSGTRQIFVPRKNWVLGSGIGLGIIPKPKTQKFLYPNPKPKIFIPKPKTQKFLYPNPKPKNFYTQTQNLNLKPKIFIPKPKT